MTFEAVSVALGDGAMSVGAEWPAQGSGEAIVKVEEADDVGSQPGKMASTCQRMLEPVRDTVSDVAPFVVATSCAAPPSRATQRR